MAETSLFAGTTLDPTLSQTHSSVTEPASQEVGKSMAPPAENFFTGTTLDPNYSATIQQPKTETTPAAPPEPEPDYGAMPWSEVGSRAVKNIIPSTVGQVKNIWSAVTHPKETGDALLTLGKGAAGKTGDFLVRQFGGEPKKWEDKEQSIAALDSVLGHYKDTYGSKEGFKKTLATDPATIGMDVASLAPVVGGGLKAAGAGETAARVASKAVGLVDPVQLSLNAAKSVVKAPVAALSAASPIVQGAATGVPSYLLRTARDIGLSTDKMGREVFNQFIKGKGDFGQIVDSADQAVAELKNAAVQNYLADINNYRKSTQQLPMDTLMDPVSGAPVGPLKELMDYVNQSGNTTRFVQGKDIAQNAYDQILDTVTSSHPSSRTFVDLDNLKRSLQDLAEHTSNFSLKGKINSVADHVKKMVVSIAPEYEKTMSDFQNWSATLRDFRSTLGASNNKMADTTKLAKMLRAVKTGKGRDLLADLSKTNAGRYIPNMLAGVAANPITPPMLRGVMETGLIGAGAYFAHPGALPALATAAINTSPRVAGNSQYLAGAFRRNFGNPAGTLVDAATSQPLTYGAAVLGEEQDKENREGRARGGAVDHEAAAEALVRAAHAAKSNISKTTESLLKTPDEHIVKALDIANKYS